MSHKPPLEGESLKLICIVLLGWSGFSLADMLNKILTQNYPPSVILTLGSIQSLILLTIWIVSRRGWSGFLSPNWKWLIVRGFNTAIVATGVVNALAYIPLSDLYGITFCAPFLAIMIAYFFLKERIGWHRMTSALIGFVGVLILLGPQFASFNSGYLFAFMAMFCIALSPIIIRKIGDKEYISLFVLYSTIAMFLSNAPLAIAQFSMPALSDLWLLSLQAFLVMMSQYATIFAIANAKTTSSVAPFVYIQALWGVLIGIFIFHDIPTVPTIIGSVIIIIAGLYMIYRERQLNSFK